MVIDTSAIIAILMNEFEAVAIADILDTPPPKLISVVSLVEVAIVIESKIGAAGVEKLDELMQTVQIQATPVTVEQANIARHAYSVYGKGRHPASLNFGDCFSYALAKVLGQPLLFKGSDFNQTDIAIVVYNE